MERNLIECCNLLGVNPGAGPAQLKSAFRALARSLHPDLNPDRPGSLDRFIRIRRAYELLMAQSGREKGEEVIETEIPWRLKKIEKDGLNVVYHLQINPAGCLAGGRLTLPVRCWEPCPECGGRGRMVNWSWARLNPVTRACGRCGSRGLIRRVGELIVRLPRAAGTGARLRVAGKGDQIRYGGPKGDLLLNIEPESKPAGGGRERGAR